MAVFTIVSAGKRLTRRRKFDRERKVLRKKIEEIGKRERLYHRLHDEAMKSIEPYMRAPFTRWDKSALENIWESGLDALEKTQGIIFNQQREAIISINKWMRDNPWLDMKDVTTLLYAMRPTERTGIQAVSNISLAAYRFTNKVAIDMAFAEIQRTEFKPDMKAWRTTLDEYRRVYRATFLDAVVKRVSEVCSKISRVRFLNSIPLFKSAVQASAIEQKRFYSQPSKFSSDKFNLRFGDWMLAQAHGYYKQGRTHKRTKDARKWLPRVGNKIPKLKYTSTKEFWSNVRQATNRFLNYVRKPKPGKIAGFLSMAIAVGADQMVNRPQGSLRPDINSDLLRRPSKHWAARARTAKVGSTYKSKKTGKMLKRGGGVKIGFGRVYGTRENPSARVFVPGSIFKRAVQPYVGPLFAADRKDMINQINKQVDRKLKASGRIVKKMIK